MPLCIVVWTNTIGANLILKVNGKLKYFFIMLMLMVLMLNGNMTNENH